VPCQIRETDDDGPLLLAPCLSGEMNAGWVRHDNDEARTFTWHAGAWSLCAACCIGVDTKGKQMEDEGGKASNEEASHAGLI